MLPDGHLSCHEKIVLVHCRVHFVEAPPLWLQASKKQGQSTGPGDSTIVTTENRARFEAEYEKTEQALLKPSLGGNTHVINLAQFERFSRDVELTARRQKRSKNGTSVPPSVAGAGRSRAPTPDLLVVGGDSRPSSGTGYLSVHRPSHVRASISMEARPRASISPVPDPPVTTGPQLSLAPPPATAQTQRSNAQSHRSGARTPSPARGSLSPLSKAAQDRASSALAMHSSGLSPPALKKSDLTTLVTAMKPKPRFHGIVRKLCRMDYMDITWLTDLASGAPLPAARLTIDNMSDDVLLKFKSEEEVNTVLLNRCVYAPWTLNALHTGHPAHCTLRNMHNKQYILHSNCALHTALDALFFMPQWAISRCFAAFCARRWKRGPKLFPLAR